MVRERGIDTTFNPDRAAPTIYYLLRSAEILERIAKEPTEGPDAKESQERMLRIASRLATTAVMKIDPKARVTLSFVD